MSCLRRMRRLRRRRVAWASALLRCWVALRLAALWVKVRMEMATPRRISRRRRRRGARAARGAGARAGREAAHVPPRRMRCLRRLWRGLTSRPERRRERRSGSTRRRRRRCSSARWAKALTPGPRRTRRPRQTRRQPPARCTSWSTTQQVRCSSAIRACAAARAAMLPGARFSLFAPLHSSLTLLRSRVGAAALHAGRAAA